MYYDYWGLTKPPFDNVPDPSMYVDCHITMENAIAETLFSIEEGDECIAVIVGNVGLGKTLSIRMVIDSLEKGKYKIALITNLGLTFVQLLREIIGQLTGKLCEGKRKADLLVNFNRLLIETINEGKKVLVFVDEANVILQKDLESIRLLTNMQDDSRNLFTIVLAGQLELVKRLENPKFANLFQRIGTYCKLDKIESKDLMIKYVNSRLLLANCTRKIFCDDAYENIWRHSEGGIPRLINKMCKLSLKAGETNELDEINAVVVDQIGRRFQKVTFSAPPKRMPRKRVKKVTKKVVKKEDIQLPVMENMAVKEKNSEIMSVENTEIVLAKEKDERLFVGLRQKVSEDGGKLSEVDGPREVEECFNIQIGESKVKITIPKNVLSEAISFTEEKQINLAGAIATKTLKENPNLTASFFIDPVCVWGEIRDFIMNKIVEMN